MEFRYETWLDGGWLASDALGHLAVMITAGPGPIPAWTLGDGYDDLDIEHRVLELAPNGVAQFVPTQPDASTYRGFGELAERGLYVYDWQDAHRVEYRNVYEAMAVPSVPRTLTDLPEDLRRIAERAFFDLEFRHALDVPMAKLVDRAVPPANQR
ncbi:hypothetical protein [Inquilinus sp. CA228]|uniref:hypothetical protein n=1 Tax=Inquilinus sp. CA228 TaxID=3455609 RepID=UPI003F8D16DB